MVLVIADKAGNHLREVQDFTLDLAFGEDENTVTVTCDSSVAPKAGHYVYIDGTEYGGTIDEQKAGSTRKGGRTMTCTGRTWHGILANKRLLPPSDSTHLTYSGRVDGLLSRVFALTGLTGLFQAEECDAQVSVSFDRFCDAYEGLTDALDTVGRKLRLEWREGKVHASAPLAVDYSAKVDSSQMDFTITKTTRCTNHLVCGGAGEGENRAVIHFYADAAGNVSHAQTLFGVDEITSFYDYTNADEEKLEEDGAKKLAKMQTHGLVEADSHDDMNVDVGDIISAQDSRTNLTVAAKVAKKVVAISKGVASYSYEVGTATTRRTVVSAIAESTAGNEYTGGDSISISGNSINVEFLNVNEIPGWF